MKIHKIIIAKKDDYLLSQGIPQEIVDYAIDLSKDYDRDYTVWIAREIWQPIKTLEKQKKSLKYLKNKREGVDGQEKLLIDNEIEVVEDKISAGEMSKVHLEKNSFDVDSTVGLTSSFRHILDWARSENPDIMQYSEAQAQVASDEWHESLKNQEITQDYKTHDVVFQLEDGWQIVKLSPQDCEAEGERMGHCVGDYSENVAKGQCVIYSLRDPKNGPHATIEVDLNNKHNKTLSEKNIQFDQIQGKGNEDPKPEYAQMIKQWMNSLEESGYTLKGLGHIEASNDLEINDLDEYGGSSFPTHDPYGNPVQYYNIGGERNGYSYDLTGIYEMSNGSWAHLEVREDHLRGLVEYAKNHNEIQYLEVGANEFNEFAQREWDDYYFDALSSRGVYYPDESDEPQKENFMTDHDESGNPALNEEAYDEAMSGYKSAFEVYEEAEREIASNFLPFQFIEELRSLIHFAGKETVNSEPAVASSKNWYKTSKKKVDGEEDHDDPKSKDIENESAIGGGTSCTSPSSVYGDYTSIQNRDFIPSRLRKKKRKKKKASENGWYKKANILDEVDVTDIEVEYENDVWDFNGMQGGGEYSLKANPSYTLDGTYGSGYYDVMFNKQALGRVYSPQDGASLVEDHIAGYLKEEDIEEPSEFAHVENQLGFTDNAGNAGYITPNGSMLNLGRGTGGEMDHRIVGGGTAGMQRFISDGNIRVDYNSGSINLYGRPTDDQRKALVQFIESGTDTYLDISDGLGELNRGGTFYDQTEKTFSQKYSAGTKAGKVFKDIEDFFSGEEPHVSEIQRLRGLASNNYWSKEAGTSIHDVTTPVAKDYRPPYETPNFSGFNGPPDIKTMKILRINGKPYISNERSMVPLSVNNLVKIYKLTPEMAVSVYNAQK